MAFPASMEALYQRKQGGAGRDKIHSLILMPKCYAALLRLVVDEENYIKTRVVGQEYYFCQLLRDSILARLTEMCNMCVLFTNSSDSIKDGA